MDQISMNRKILIPNILLGGVLLIYVLTFFNNLASLSLNVYITFLINFVVVVAGILKCDLPISLNKINWYFLLIFLVIIPFYQLTSGYAPRSMHLTEYEIIFTNVLILLWCIGYYLSYNLKQTELRVMTGESLVLPKSKSFYLFIVIVSVLCLAYESATTGFANLFIRGTSDFDEDTFGIMIYFLTRSIPAISLAIYLWTIKKKIRILPKYQMYTLSFLLFLVTFILNNPVTLSRFLIGAIYMGLLISIFDISLFKGKRFDILLIFSIVIIFPLMYALKFYTIEQIMSPEYTLEINNYNSVDFDAFQMIGRTIRFVETYGYQYGRQLRSVLFFFMPRDILDIKGIPSGQLVATIQNVSYTNLSSPIVAEGFIDFGIAGVILYSLVFGRIAKFFDYKTYTLKKDSTNIYFIEITFSFLIGYLVYIYRGALQPTFLRLMGFFLFLIVIYAMNKAIHFKKIENK
ncbi:MAG: oligosaccharide repeat unit polymerase [Alkalibacterium sp.]|nr:oligosaccharide repeat unit polymerase [Alkalibacterium sp.]